MRLVHALAALAFAPAVVDAFAPRGSTARAAARSTILAAVPTLEDWTLRMDDTLKAKVYGHPDMDDGDYITTSPILDPNKAYANGMVRTMTGSRYRLAQPAAAAAGKASGGGGKDTGSGKGTLFGALAVAAALFLYLNGSDSPDMSLLATPVATPTDNGAVLMKSKESKALEKDQTKAAPVEKAKVLMEDIPVLRAIPALEEKAPAKVEAPAVVESPPVVETVLPIIDAPVATSMEPKSVEKTAMDASSTKEQTAPFVQIGAVTLIGAAAIAAAVSKQDEIESLVKPNLESSSSASTKTSDSGLFDFFLQSPLVKTDTVLSESDLDKAPESTLTSPELLGTTARTSSPAQPENSASSSAASSPLTQPQRSTAMDSSTPPTMESVITPSLPLESESTAEVEDVAINEEEEGTDELAVDGDATAIPQKGASKLDDIDESDDVASVDFISVADLPMELEDVDALLETLPSVEPPEGTPKINIDEEDTQASISIASDSSTVSAPPIEDVLVSDVPIESEDYLESAPAVDLTTKVDVAIDEEESELSFASEATSADDTPMDSTESGSPSDILNHDISVPGVSIESEVPSEPSAIEEVEDALNLMDDDGKDTETSFVMESPAHTEVSTIDSSINEVAPIEDTDIPDATTPSVAAVEAAAGEELESTEGTTIDDEETELAKTVEPVSIVDTHGLETVKTSSVDDPSSEIESQAPSAPHEPDVESTVDVAVDDEETGIVADSDSIFEDTEMEKVEGSAVDSLPLEDSFVPVVPPEGRNIPDAPSTVIEANTPSDVLETEMRDMEDIVVVDGDNAFIAKSDVILEDAKIDTAPESTSLDAVMDDEDTVLSIEAESGSILEGVQMDTAEDNNVITKSDVILEDAKIDTAPESTPLDAVTDEGDTVFSIEAESDSILEGVQMDTIAVLPVGDSFGPDIPVEESAGPDAPSSVVDSVTPSDLDEHEIASLDDTVGDEDAELASSAESDSVLDDAQMDTEPESSSLDIAVDDEDNVPAEEALLSDSHSSAIESETASASLELETEIASPGVAVDDEDGDPIIVAPSDSSLEETPMDTIELNTVGVSSAMEISIPDSPSVVELEALSASLESTLAAAAFDEEDTDPSRIVDASDSTFEETQIGTIEDTSPSEALSPSEPVETGVGDAEDGAKSDGSAQFSFSSQTDSVVETHMEALESSSVSDAPAEPSESEGALEIATDEASSELSAEASSEVLEPSASAIDKSPASDRPRESEIPAVDGQGLETLAEQPRGLASSSWPSSRERFPQSRPSSRSAFNAPVVSRGAFGLDKFSGAASLSAPQRSKVPTASTSIPATPASFQRGTKTWDRSTRGSTSVRAPTATSGPHAVQLESSATASEPIGARSPTGSLRSEKAAAMEKVMKRLQRARQQQQEIIRPSESKRR